MIFLFLKFFMAEFSRLAAIYSLDPKLTFSDLKKGNIPQDLDTSKLEHYAREHQILAVSQLDLDYPNKLKNQPSSPFLFYYQGDLSLLSRPIFWLVGPRNPSDYASQVMQALFLQSYKYDIVTISGFARGIDQQAHQLSLKYQIPTIAVLWWGFQHYLRGKDRDLLDQIVKNGGLVISQFKIWFEPTKRSFPARNKLLAQLCDVLFLPEAQQKSGSLITTEFAYQFKKPVYSVPAPIFAQQSAGIFSKMEEKKLTLISDFTLCLDAHFHPKGEILATNHTSQQASFDSFSPQQRQILDHLKIHWELSLEALISDIQFEYGVIMQELTLLEMDGILKQSRPGYYSLV